MSADSYYHIVLFNRLLKGKLSPKDTEALIEWLSSDELDPQAAELILQQLQKPVNDGQVSPEIINALEAKLPAVFSNSLKDPSPKTHFLRTNWFRYAAAVLILFAGIATYLFLFPKKQSGNISKLSLKPAAIDIPPGKQGAVLTLSDGRVIALDNIGNGLIATQDGVKILFHNGQVTYNSEGSTGVVYNTMTTQKGRQFQLVLPDGTKVWLNAASSIRYPTLFPGKERKVEITGEAYFEVTKDPQKPFYVIANKQTEVRVLGTHFNVNAYTNETSINTTLLEGSVQIINGHEKVFIRPGQQARVNGDQDQSPIKIVSDVNIDKVMAWKNGVFDFQDATLEEVMRQLERWYDIDVLYEKGVPKIEFMGKMGRDLTLNEVIRGLAVSKVHCRLEEGRKLVVMP